MVVARHIRPALLALAATLPFFLAQAEAASSPTLSFSSCVTSCIEIESCETSDVKCVCKGARSKLLQNVATCMYYKCPNEVSSFASSFLTPLESACKAIKVAIPKDKIEDAEETAQLYADKLPKTTSSKVVVTTTPTTSARAAPTPKTTTTTSPAKPQSTSTTTSKAQPTTETESSSTTTTSSEEEESTTTSSPATSSTPDSVATTSTPTTLATATNSPSRAVTQSTSSTKSAGRTDPTDSSPFATPNAAERGTMSWLLASLPLALAVAMR